jgi:hypothetical protein
VTRGKTRRFSTVTAGMMALLAVDLGRYTR